MCASLRLDLSAGPHFALCVRQGLLFTVAHARLADL